MTQDNTIYIHVDYDHKYGQFVIRRKIGEFPSLSEEDNDPHWVKTPYLYGENLTTELAIRDKLIQLVAPEAQQWSLTAAARQMIQEIILFNLE